MTVETPDEVQKSSPRFRWRVYGAAPVGAIGALLLTAGLLVFFLMAYTTWTGKPMYEPGPSGFSREGFLVGFWGVNCGGMLLLAAALWWKGRWWSALAVVAACFAVGGIASACGMFPEG